MGSGLHTLMADAIVGPSRTLPCIYEYSSSIIPVMRFHQANGASGSVRIKTVQALETFYTASILLPEIHLSQEGPQTSLWAILSKRLGA
jgi:hypothetical protein